MKRAIASAVGLAVIVSGLVAAAPALADVRSFANPEATASTTDLDIGSVDIDHSPASVRMTANVQNLTVGTYGMSFFVTPTAVPAFETTSDEYLVQVNVVNDAPSEYYVTHYSGKATPPPESLSTAGVVFSRAGNALTIDLPRARLPWTGAVYVAARVGTDDGVRGYAGTRAAGKVVGFGPVYATARQTSVALALSANSVTAGGAATTATATVSPSNAPGVIVFTDGATTLAAVTVSAGTAAYAIPSSLSAGAHSIAAEYVPGDATAWTGSRSGAASFTVVASPAPVVASPAPVTPTTTPTVTATAAALATGVRFTLTKRVQHKGKSAAKVTITATGSRAGTVYVYDGKKRLKALKLKKGKASYTLSKKLARGKHRLYVLFVPTNSSTYARSTSVTKTVTVKR